MENIRPTIFVRMKLDDGAKAPTKAHEDDAGFDMYSRTDEVVKAHSSCVFDTGVHIQIPSGYVGFLKSKSGMNCKYSIVNEGVIDAGYTGPIIIKLYNNSDDDYIVRKGDKISQLVFLSIPNFSLFTTDELYTTERGEGRMGSTGMR